MPQDRTGGAEQVLDTVIDDMNLFRDLNEDFEKMTILGDTFKKITYTEPGLNPVECLLKDEDQLFFSVEETMEKQGKTPQEYYIPYLSFMYVEGYDQIMCMGYVDDVYGNKGLLGCLILDEEGFVTDIVGIFVS